MKKQKVNNIIAKCDWAFTDKGQGEDWISNTLYATPEVIAAAGFKVDPTVAEKNFSHIYFEGYTGALKNAPAGYLPVAAFGGIYSEIMAPDRAFCGYSVGNHIFYLVDAEGDEVYAYNLPEDWQKELEYPDAKIYREEDYEDEDED